MKRSPSSFEEVQPLTSIDSAMKDILSKVNILKQKVTGKPQQPDPITSEEFDFENYYQSIQNVLVDIINQPEIGIRQRLSTRSTNKEPTIIPKTILSLKDIPNISYICEFSDDVIVTGTNTGKVIFWSINYNQKGIQFQFLFEQNIHKDTIFSLCKFQNDYLISSSLDGNISIWELKNNELHDLYNIKINQNYARKVLELSNNRIGCCADNCPILILDLSEAHHLTKLAELDESKGVNTLLQLSGKEILIASIVLTNSLSFWNLKTYSKIGTLSGVCTFHPDGMIELPNSNIAVSNYFSSYSISIVDTEKISIVQEIKSNMNFPECSGLLLWKEEYIVYACNGILNVISINDYKIITANDKDNTFDGHKGMISVINGNYLLMNNLLNGIDIVDLQIIYN